MAVREVAASGAARFWLTDRGGGASTPPYDQFNLGDHVGDDPAVVAANRDLLASGLGRPAPRLAWMRQVHGAHVVTLGAGGAEGAVPGVPPWPAADGLVTARPGLALAVLVADCVPVLFASADPAVVGVAHAGRRGMADGVVSATLAAMATLGALPDHIHAFVGPSICGRCYEVPVELQAAVGTRVAASITTTRSGRPGLDLRAGVAAQLAGGGVGAVTVDPRCTAESAELYSHRRDGITGRFAGIALVALPD